MLNDNEIKPQNNENFFTRGNLPDSGYLEPPRGQVVAAGADDVQRSLGDISQRMLTVTLRSLEADGLVHREVYPEVPPRVEYRLTDSGGDLMPYLNSLVEWALKNTPAILERRAQAVRAK